MKTRNWLTALVGAGVFASGVAYADVWDGGAFGSGGDNGTFTANRLTRGTGAICAHGDDLISAPRVRP